MKRNLMYWLAGIVSLLLAAELVLQALPVSSATKTGYHIDPQILTYPLGHEWTTATGWDLRNAQQHKANNAGFLAQHDFVPDPRAVALIGDSFVEASMLPMSDRPAAQLERALGDRPVYAFGGPGSALLDYAERIRLATTRYDIRDVVILMERSDVRQSLCGSGNIHSPCIDRQTLEPRSERQPAPGLAKRVLRNSALLQYLGGQLKIQPASLWQQIVAQSRPVDHTRSSENPAGKSPGEDPTLAAQALVARTFFEHIAGLVRGKLIIVVDANRSEIYRSSRKTDPEREQFMEIAKQNGAIVVDTAPLFEASYKGSGLKFDVGPYDRHLNRLGVSIVMTEAASRFVRDGSVRSR